MDINVLKYILRVAINYFSNERKNDKIQDDIGSGIQTMLSVESKPDMSTLLPQDLINIITWTTNKRSHEPKLFQSFGDLTPDRYAGLLAEHDARKPLINVLQEAYESKMQTLGQSPEGKDFAKSGKAIAGQSEAPTNTPIAKNNKEEKEL